MQKSGGVNDETLKTDAAQAAMMIRNGLLTRLVLLSASSLCPDAKHDMHVARAFELLRWTLQSMLRLRHVGLTDL